MQQFEIRVVVEAKNKPSALGVVMAIEKGFKEENARVVSMVDTLTCPVCGEAAEIKTTFVAERKQWWEFWRSDYELPKYGLDSAHACYCEAADKFADANSPWRRRVSE